MRNKMKDLTGTIRGQHRINVILMIPQRRSDIFAKPFNLQLNSLIGGNMENTENNEVDALCPECGYSFKAYVDRLLSEAEINRSDKEDVSCPVCSCTKCEIGR